MDEFLHILTHGRRLQGAVRDLSVQELEEVLVKFKNIVELRKQKEREKQQAAEEKKAKIADIQKQLLDAGLSYNDLTAPGVAPLSRKFGKKRAIKYSYTDDEGEIHNWTGVGRMPKVFSNIIDRGEDLETYRYKETS